MQMGRDVTGLRIDKKTNMVNDKSNGTLHSAVHAAPKALPEKSERKDYQPEDHNTKGRLPNEFNEQQDVLGVKSTNHEPAEKIIKAEAQKSTDKKLSSPAKPASGSAANSFEPLTPGLEADKQTSSATYANGTENNNFGVQVLPKSNDSHSPKSSKKSQSNSNFMSRKLPQPNDKNYYDEEDNWSLASSTATSVRTRITVPVAPRFSCVDRLERRKEFYSKLEEKHKALEKEKLEYEARTKEDEQAAIKQLRKTMVYKANPVPSFYREGPPPKVELKKLPVTRAKSPNLTRRKSCGDAVKSSPDDKGLCGRATRHSVGIYREGKASPVQKKSSPLTPKSKDHAGLRKSNGSNKVKKNSPQQFKETTGSSHVKEEANVDVSVES
ncbi:protein WVD2-like 2 isoform X1 [Sesamum indicum]|uniref:Protein WVD2-like 2 isoform X1 n=2 Tax=Sesamum indicum TaxID=4182 RepID=A0A6I9UCP0_SESIN|nr:protein WVD2-like 2 isoform X1 [Sesamum indicum]